VPVQTPREFLRRDDLAAGGQQGFGRLADDAAADHNYALQVDRLNRQRFDHYVAS
jgi:hypothetical protein